VLKLPQSRRGSRTGAALVLGRAVVVSAVIVATSVVVAAPAVVASVGATPSVVVADSIAVSSEAVEASVVETMMERVPKASVSVVKVDARVAVGSTTSVEVAAVSIPEEMTDDEGRHGPALTREIAKRTEPARSKKRDMVKTD